MNNRPNYVSGQVAQEVLGVHANTLRRWANEGKIDFIRKTPQSKRLYNVDKVISENGNNTTADDIKKQICYCRVSSKQQADDLQRQISYMQNIYPRAEIVSDVGSGINWKRKGLKYIINKATRGEVKEVIVAYRDRLCRFAFELIEYMLELHQVKILVLNQSEVESGSNQELADDLLSIIHIFNCKAMGKRKYKRTTTDNKIEKI